MSVYDDRWVNWMLSLIYERAHREREEELERQLQEHLSLANNQP